MGPNSLRSFRRCCRRKTSSTGHCRSPPKPCQSAKSRARRLLTALPLAVPQEPFTAEEATGAEQLAVVPPLLPAQDQFHGPLPVTAEAVPIVQSPVLGAVLTALPLAVPQEPFTAEEATGAEQLAVVPPLLPAQDQFHGPLPVTAEAVPIVQSPVLGAVLTALPLAVPQEPFTAEEATGAEQLTIVPLVPKHTQVPRASAAHIQSRSGTT